MFKLRRLTWLHMIYFLDTRWVCSAIVKILRVCHCIPCELHFLATHQKYISHIISLLVRYGEELNLINNVCFVLKSIVCYDDCRYLNKKRTVLYGFAWKASTGDGTGPARVGYGSGTLCCPTRGYCARDRCEIARNPRPKRSGPGRLANRICAWRTPP